MNQNFSLEFEYTLSCKCFHVHELVNTRDTKLSSCFALFEELVESHHIHCYKPSQPWVPKTRQLWKKDVAPAFQGKGFYTTAQRVSFIKICLKWQKKTKQHLR